jgi:hypothetical protein
MLSGVSRCRAALPNTRVALCTALSARSCACSAGDSDSNTAHTLTNAVSPPKSGSSTGRISTPSGGRSRKLLSECQFCPATWPFTWSVSASTFCSFG